jgi:hypothetical protein
MAFTAMVLVHRACVCCKRSQAGTASQGSGRWFVLRDSVLTDASGQSRDRRVRS